MYNSSCTLPKAIQITILEMETLHMKWVEQRRETSSVIFMFQWLNNIELFVFVEAQSLEFHLVSLLDFVFDMILELHWLSSHGFAY